MNPFTTMKSSPLSPAIRLSLSPKLLRPFQWRAPFSVVSRKQVNDKVLARRCDLLPIFSRPQKVTLASAHSLPLLRPTIALLVHPSWKSTRKRPSARSSLLHVVMPPPGRARDAFHDLASGSIEIPPSHWISKRRPTCVLYAPLASLRSGHFFFGGKATPPLPSSAISVPLLGDDPRMGPDSAILPKFGEALLPLMLITALLQGSPGTFFFPYSNPRVVTLQFFAPFLVRPLVKRPFQTLRGLCRG